MSGPSDLVLAGEFPAATREEWLAGVDKAIKGRDFARTLVTTTLDGIAVQPLYTADDVPTAHDESGFPGRDPLVRGQTVAPRPDGAWDIRARVAHPVAATANAQALSELRGGANSLDLLVDASGSGEGVSCRDGADLARVLDGVLLDLAPVSLRAGAHAAVVGGWFLDLARERGGAVAPGCLGVDPLGTLAFTGELPQGLSAALADGVALAVSAAALPGVRTFRASGLAAADAGASEAQELAFVLACAVAYLRALVEAGHDVTSAAAQVDLEVFADVDVFATVAKTRALRRCWAAILDVSGVDVDATRGRSAKTGSAGLEPTAQCGDVSAANARVSGVAGGRWLTAVDPWVNLLRGTAASLAAVVGGADSLVVAPFDSAGDSAGGLAGDHAQRLARNTQLLLQDESYVGRVLDPGGGSYYIEALTDALAQAGWALFQRIEAVGGLAAALAAGTIQAEIAATAATRDAAIATRSHPITGVSEFPLIVERLPDPVPVPQADPRPPVPLAGTPTVVAPLVPRRLSEPFEALRAAADVAPVRPAVFLANIGTGPAYIPRATFASNAFAAAGIASAGDGGYPDAQAAAAAFAGSGAPVAVICGTDDAYAEQAAAYAEVLKAAGARRVYLAGRAGEHADAWAAAGIDAYVGVGTDVLAVMGDLHALLLAPVSADSASTKGAAT